MKKGLLVAFGLMAVMVLSACNNGGKSWWEEPVVRSVSLNDLYGKTALTLEDLNNLENLAFPTSYSYETYNLADWSIIAADEYTYPTDGSSKWLLPIHESMVSREITSSSMEDWMIYTKADLTLNDGTVVPVLYINDWETLKYSFAAIYGETDTTLYTFSY